MATIETVDERVDSNFESEDQLRALLTPDAAAPAVPADPASPAETPGSGPADAAAPLDADASKPDQTRDAEGKWAKESPQKRIARAVYFQREAERRAAAEAERAARLEQELAGLRTRGPAPASSDPPSAAPAERFPEYAEWLAQPGNGDKPYEEYLDVRTEYRLERRLQGLQERQQQDRAQRSHAEIMAGHHARVEAFKAKTPDYEAVLAKAGQEVQISAAMGAAITSSESGPEIVYYLATHPTEAADLLHLTAHLDPSVASLLVQRTLEDRLRQSPAPNGSGRSAAPRTQAPAPIRPVGTGSVASDEPPGDSASDDEHIAYWNRKDREARRR